MTAVELIEKKRDGGTLSDEEIRWLIRAYTADEVADYQMAAMLMAIFHHGLSVEELAVWAEAMLHSGDTLDFSDITAPKVDKHSTGGVGDKVSIALAPMVAACGVAVPMMSGRGLGHTGGTLDKLEAIPGFRTQVDPSEFHHLLKTIGMVMGGQTETLVPADRRLYALRDVTGTVPSIPLISSSIMSKKLAEDIDALVLDVKVGRGAFMKQEDQARILAETMVGIGSHHDTEVVALLTAMDEPLGTAVGNANETAECIELLKGDAPPDITEITFRLAEEMLVLGGVADSLEDARMQLEATITDGTALEKLEQVIVAQDGDPAVLEDYSLLPQPPQFVELEAPREGWVTMCDARRIGVAGVQLGGGRLRKEDEVDPAVGIWVFAKEGEQVEQGEPLARVGWRHGDRLGAAMEILEDAWAIGDEAPEPKPLIMGKVR
ncbi:MAG: thymidine phosphorylase [Acidimicrobiia bacterium]|nr:thymidine phosphorylase [Acidimicrobiia bacterium]NNF10674.1 thymidine phosphorylase [Acidimicrobiia bacterium]NNL70892.1 thymidine phosphorylase [Acidimicrobiia bacterium]